MNFQTYLLVGFVISWVGTNVFNAPAANGWKWELVAVVIWPAVVIASLTLAVMKYLPDRKDAA